MAGPSNRFIQKVLKNKVQNFQRAREGERNIKMDFIDQY